MGFWVSLLGVLILTLHYYIPASEDNLRQHFLLVLNLTYGVGENCYNHARTAKPLD